MYKGYDVPVLAEAYCIFPAPLWIICSKRTFIECYRFGILYFRWGIGRYFLGTSLVSLLVPTERLVPVSTYLCTGFSLNSYAEDTTSGYIVGTYNISD
jgi:hypothetical protein